MRIISSALLLLIVPGCSARYFEPVPGPDGASGGIFLQVYLVVTLIAVGIILAVTVKFLLNWMGWGSKKGESPEARPGHRLLEVIWTLTAVALLIIISCPVWRGLIGGG